MAKTLFENIATSYARHRAEKRSREAHRSFADNAALKAIKPREGYVFHDDYYEVDGGFATILTLYHSQSGTHNFGPFWMINSIPAGLPPEVTVINIEQVNRMSDKWIQDHQNQAEDTANKNAEQQGLGGTNATKSKAVKAVNDMAAISEELANGAAYLHVQIRLVVKAPTLEMLDFAVERIASLYADSHRFTTIKPVSHDGAMREELANIYRANAAKRGHGFYFTSTEYAGAYDLVTHGLEDRGGEYVGVMTGDVNNAAVIFDVDGYSHHVVVATNQFNDQRVPGKRILTSDMWGAKIGQAALLDGHRVTHLLLGTDCDMADLGPTFPRITQTIDMTRGDVNMWQVFGTVEDELAAFPRQMTKILLMAEQAYKATDEDRSIIRGSLEQIATRFYVYSNMWVEDAKKHRDEIRLVGLPNDQYPLLHTFTAYLDQAYTAAVKNGSQDAEQVHALNVLRTTFNNLLSNNGDLFDKHTSPTLERAMEARRVIYDFSGLMSRGHGVAMAQLVNVVDLALSHLGLGDVVIIHSAQNIDPGVQDYVRDQFDRLFSRGGRVALLYDSVEGMLDASDFNQFDAADYTLLGNMRDNTMRRYQDELGRPVPPSLSSLVTDKSEAVMYCRRGYDNIVFRQDLLLDIDETAHFQRGARF